ncbi:phospholipase D-like domain-containing protein DpdK [Sandaracinobacteroides hominis]|uniref:phospholipase D-like domain-containing protein DpdK n=1 Tax=Sandaracinobacteroides hominis TaxID=2780086 RepID=UPI0018F66933|nr:phospholipase D-like domain-containing protein DpdK [Sandaracinobacteroides hominis]
MQTRRFAHERGALSHWIPVDPAFPEQDRRISDYALEHEFVGTFTGSLNERVDSAPLLVFRPWTVRLERAARTEALPSSNARLLWQSDIVANGDALGVPVPTRSEWQHHVRAIDFHLHRFRSSVSVRRFAGTAQANVRILQDDFAVTLQFMSDDDRPAAVGFELEVDGFRLDLALPNAETLAGNTLPLDVLATSKLAYVRDLIRLDPDLPNDVNQFQREWLVQFLLSALLADASSTKRPLAESIADLLDDDRIEAVFGAVMNDVFGAMPPTPPDAEDTEDADAEEDPDGNGHAPDGTAGVGATGGGGRLQQALLQQLARPIVRDRLRALMPHPSRDLHGPAQSRAVRDLFQSLFIAELIHPSPKIWLFFAWISDVEIVDNSAREFAALEPDWPAAPIRLSQLLRALLTRGVQIRLVIREDGHNDYVIARLQALKARFGDQIKWTVEKSFHAKGLLGADYFLSGSMNLTLNGISINGEHLVLRTDPAVVAEQSIELESRWEGQMA